MPKGKSRKPRVGPLGGTTNFTPGGLVRKATHLEPKVEEVLRRKAYKERKSEASILRQALLEHLGMAPREGEQESTEKPGKK
jgi:hypothetical protein